MFRLHDNTRRQLCMAAFLGLCVLPTFAVGGWAIARRLPWNCQAEAARLSGELGVAVSIESMTHTLPGVVRYKGLKFSDPETGRELLRCGELEATWTSFTDSLGQRPAVVLEARQVESAGTAWERLEEVLRRRLECQSGRPEVEFRADRRPVAAPRRQRIAGAARCRPRHWTGVQRHRGPFGLSTSQDNVEVPRADTRGPQSFCLAAS